MSEMNKAEVLVPHRKLWIYQAMTNTIATAFFSLYLQKQNCETCIM
jgi:hypothetical protein